MSPQGESRHPWARRYGVAVLAVALVLAIKVLLDIFVQVESPFLLLSAAVLVSAIYGGFGPGVFAALLAALIGDFFFLPPVGTFVPPDVGHGLTTLLFLAQGLAISAIGAWLTSARRRAEGALRSLSESEERFRSLVEASTSFVWSVDLEGRFVEPQPSWEAYTGQPWEEHRDFGWTRALHPDDRERVREIWERAHHRRSLFESEGRLWHAPSGTYRHFFARAVPLLGADGSVREWIGMVNDVDDRKRAEDALHFLAEASGVLSSSLDYRETLASVARLAVPRMADWCAVDVLSEEEDGPLERLAVAHPDPEKVALAYQLQERYPPDPDAPRGVHQVLRTGEPEMMSEIPEELIEEAARDERHGEILRELGLRSYMVVPLVARGRTLGSITFVTAESERRYGEADLEVAQDLARRAAVALDNARLYGEAQRVAEVRARLAAIVESSDDAIIGKTLDGTITSWNQGAQKIYGYSAEEVVGKPIDILVPPDRPDEIPEILERIRNGEAIDHYETVRVTKDGRYLDISLTVSPIRGSVGSIVGASAIARDITERKRAEEALRMVREAERERMARDLHDGALQDLTYALAEAQLARMLTEDSELDNRLEQVVSTLKRGTQGLRDAVYNLSIQEERNRSLPESLENLLEMNRQMNPGCTIRLNLEDEVSSAPLEERGVELLRIVQEALNNVRKHSGAENVLISLRTKGDELVAEVEDDGRGFDPDSTQAGVGQRSMRERAAALGGELEVESEPRRGTRVRVLVPLTVRDGERGKRG